MSIFSVSSRQYPAPLGKANNHGFSLPGINVFSLFGYRPPGSLVQNPAITQHPANDQSLCDEVIKSRLYLTP